MLKKWFRYFIREVKKAVCYFAGGVTDGKSDKQKFKDAGLVLEGGDGWGNKPLNIKNKKKLQPLLRDRFKRAYQYGCDAVEVDCIDVYHYTNKITKNDVLVFTKWLAETAHEENISIGLKNVATISEKLQPYFDFAVVESCAESPNVCDYYKAFTKNNKAVFIVHYGNRGWNLSGNKFKTLKKEQGGRKFTCVLSNNQDLKGHTKNYNCDTSAEINYGVCPEGQCCSKYGWCGITDEHCSVGCQRDYGECLTDFTNDEY
ncbi:carbohydrate-binding module family 18 protein [Piromyces sp. E2]|nr:carbohydrate-binding module family 18 protein [Piromyces sp. E2]|eukprot:OUM60965.1 carbohydrate-binding module family 18 protein [Piromyces sp. E2]